MRSEFERIVKCIRCNSLCCVFNKRDLCDESSPLWDHWLWKQRPEGCVETDSLSSWELPWPTPKSPLEIMSSTNVIINTLIWPVGALCMLLIFQWFFSYGSILIVCILFRLKRLNKKSYILLISQFFCTSTGKWRTWKLTRCQSGFRQHQ